MPVRCMYLQCKTEVYKSNKSLFRFPIKNPKRLEEWIQNCGNPRIAKYSKGALKSQYICIDHFEKKFIRNEGGQRKRLTKDAVPIPYEWDASKLFTDLPAESTTEEYQTSSSGGRYRKVPVITEDSCLFEDCRLADETSEPEPGSESDHQQLRVQVPSRVYRKRMKTDRTTDVNDVEVVPSHRCAECHKPTIKGFQWWCVTCGARCGACALRMAHRAHMLLRAPLHATYEQTRVVIAAILQQLRAEELVAPRDVVRHVDHNGVELCGGEEPLVKTEPADAAADPLHDSDEHDSDRDDPDYRACLDALHTDTLPNLPDLDQRASDQEHLDRQLTDPEDFDHRLSDQEDRDQCQSDQKDLDRRLSDQENLDQCLSDQKKCQHHLSGRTDLDQRLLDLSKLRKSSSDLDPLSQTQTIDFRPSKDTDNPEKHSTNQDSTDLHRQYRRKRKLGHNRPISIDHRPTEVYLSNKPPDGELIDYQPSNDCTSINLPVCYTEKCLSLEDFPPSGLDNSDQSELDVRYSASIRSSIRYSPDRSREQHEEWFSMSQSHGLYFPEHVKKGAGSRVADKSSNDQCPLPRVIKRTRVRTRTDDRNHAVNASTRTQHTSEKLKSTASAEQNNDPNRTQKLQIQANTEKCTAQQKKIKVISRKFLEKKNIKLYVKRKPTEANDNPN
ncbi:uncharacterized protein LOC134751483 isoform X2 [Cydia strobilella]|uniref:uncharacterized protein LOC134751483 isoform X2 n=1 Tax=Cydia strobilella TaxID=1100964 RepID=UPI00300760BC